VDDSPYNLFILKEILLTMENTDRTMIKQALNGQEALEIITSKENLYGNRSKFDIIFLDLHMPVLDGF
jgi:CheY-like chemotaxis protein